jgi:nifR3 family TIM-barrel protein
MLKIGNITAKNNVVLAPMAGVCNPAFRLIAKEFGCGLVCAEMVSDKAIVHGNKRSLEMLFGDTETLVEAAKVVDRHTNADIIDINMGCPVPKITKCDAGARWLLDPAKIEQMIATVVKAVNKPVTVKMRIGWDDDHIYAVQNAKAVENGGGQAVSVHGRTRVQMYTGTANWDIIKEVKESVSIPVIGNGDVFTPEDARRMLDHTGCDGVMIGRAALGNPWMLYRTIRYLTDGELLPEPSAQEKMRIAILHMDRLIDLRGERIAVKEMRKHMAWYLKGLHGSAKVKDIIMELTERDPMVAVLNDFVLNFEQSTIAVPFEPQPISH